MIIAAPVVPTSDASAVPITMRTAFTAGVPRSEPATWMPPPIVNRVAIRMRNGT